MILLVCQRRRDEGSVGKTLYQKSHLSANQAMLLCLATYSNHEVLQVSLILFILAYQK